MRTKPHLLLLLTILTTASLSAQSPEWIRPRGVGDALIWGRKDGIVFGLPSDGGLPGPRGLIRVGTIDKSTGRAKLLNYIAIEPVTAGNEPRGDRMGFSELESSGLDKGMQGARLWVGNETSAKPNRKGKLQTIRRGDHSVEVLSVRIEIERFTENGAHVYLLLSIASDHPNELRLAAYPYPDSKPLDEMTFTATMGAYERLRLLWLKNTIVDSRKLYSAYSGPDFAEEDTYPVAQMLRDSNGNPIALCTSSEQAPSSGRNPQAKPHWYYDGPRIAQYWRIDAKDVQPNLRVRVNGRHTYWQSDDAIPGGTSFENFELRETFRPGQSFIFGISNIEPYNWIPPLANLGTTPQLDSAN